MIPFRIEFQNARPLTPFRAPSATANHKLVRGKQQLARVVKKRRASRRDGGGLRSDFRAKTCRDSIFSV